MIDSTTPFAYESFIHGAYIDIKHIMKNYIHFIIIFFVISCLMLSCSKQYEFQGIEEDSKQLFTFNASFSSKEQTKTLFENRETLWSPYDSITIYSNNNAYKFYSHSSIPSKTASFSGYFTKSFTGNEYAVYPALNKSHFVNEYVKAEIPTIQFLPENSVPEGVLVSLAKVNNGNLSFHPVCSIIGFKLKNDSIATIYFKTSRMETVAGTALFGIDNNGKPGLFDLVDTEPMITLKPKSSDTFEKDKWYYFATLPNMIIGDILFYFEKGGKYGTQLFPQGSYFLFSGEGMTFEKVDNNLIIGNDNVYPLQIGSTTAKFAIIKSVSPTETFSMNGHYVFKLNGHYLSQERIYPGSHGTTVFYLSGLTPNTDNEFVCLGVNGVFRTAKETTPNYGGIIQAKIHDIKATSATFIVSLKKNYKYYYTVDGSDPSKTNGVEVSNADQYIKVSVEPNNKYEFKILCVDPNGEDEYDILVRRFETPASNPTPSAKVSVYKTDATTIILDVMMSKSTDYIRIYRGQGTSGSYKTYKRSSYSDDTQRVSYNSLSSSKKYYFTIVPYNSDDQSGEPVEIYATTGTAPYTNFFEIEGDYYEINSVKMTVDRPGGTLANWSNLRFCTSNSTSFVLFEYSKPYYEGITSNWPDGTYIISGETGYYKYVCLYNCGTTSVRSAVGKLVINTVNNVKIFSFELEDKNSGKKINGYCYGVQ